MQDAMRRIGANVEVYEQVGPAFSPAEEATGRYVQVIRFRDRRHLVAVQAAEKSDPVLQSIIAEFVVLVDLAGQQAAGTYLPGYYSAVTPADGSGE